MVSSSLENVLGDTPADERAPYRAICARLAVYGSPSSIDASLSLGCERRPLAGYTFEGRLAARFELDVRSGHEQWDDT